MATQVVEKVIKIDVIASANAQKNIDLIARDMKKVEDNTTKMQNELNKGFGSLARFGGSLASFLGAFGVATGIGAVTRSILDMSSAYAVMESRLRVIIGSQARTSVAMEDIVDIAKLTGKELDGVSKLYEKATRSGQQFGISQESVRQITLGFAQAIRLSGSSTQEAYASLVQFGQALASGRLQGDEFRSLMENNSVFMYEFANAAGVSVTQLRKMGSDGKLNAEFLFNTMLKQGKDGLNMLERLNKMAADVPLTFRQSFTALTTSATTLVGELSKLFSGVGDSKAGVFNPIVVAIDNIIERIKTLRIESAALGEGAFGKILGLLKTAVGYTEVGRIIGANSFGDSREDALKRLTELQKKYTDSVSGSTKAIEILRAAKANLESRGVDPVTQVSRIAQLEADRARDQAELIRVSNARNELLFGEVTSPELKLSRGIREKVTTPTEPTTAQKAAANALREFIQLLEDEVAAQKLLASGYVSSTEAADRLTRAKRILADVGQTLDGKTGKRISGLIQEAESMKEIAKEKEKLEAARVKELEQYTLLEEKIQTVIDKDKAAIEAIKNKTRASQEYTTNALEAELSSSKELLNILNQFGKADDVAIRRLKDRIRLYEEAIAGRRALEDAQSLSRADKEQLRVNEEREKEVQTLADQINSALKRNLGDKKNGIGQALLENIRSQFRNQTIDIVINPITTLISRMFAELALSFGKQISEAVALSLANTSSDPLGMFIDLMGFSKGPGGGAPVTQGATGIQRVPYDNFIASLHRDERVLTSREAKEYAAGMARQPIVVNFSPQTTIDARSDQAQVAKNVSAALQENNRQLLLYLEELGVTPPRS